MPDGFLRPIANPKNRPHAKWTARSDGCCPGVITKTGRPNFRRMESDSSFESLPLSCSVSALVELAEAANQVASQNANDRLTESR